MAERFDDMSRNYAIEGTGGVVIFAWLIWVVNQCSTTPVSSSATGNTSIANPVSVNPSKSTPLRSELLIRDSKAAAVVVNSKGLFWVGGYDSKNLGKKSAKVSLLVRLEPSGKVQRVSDRVDYPYALVATEDGVYWTDGCSILEAKSDGSSARFFKVGRPDVHVESLAVQNDIVSWRTKAHSTGECALSIGSRTKRTTKVIAVDSEHCGSRRLSLSNNFLVWTTMTTKVCHMAVADAKPECDGRAVAATIDNGKIFATIDHNLVFFPVGKYGDQTKISDWWVADDKLILHDGYMYGSQQAWNMKGAHPGRIWRVGSTGTSELLADRKSRYSNEFDVFGGKVYWPDADAGGVMAASLSKP